MSRPTLGRHWPGDSFWHRRDPLVKLVLLFTLVVPVVAARELWVLSALAAMAGSLWVSARLPFRLLLGVLRAFSWLVVLTLAANLLAVPDAAGRLTWPPHPTMANLNLAALNVLRLIVLFSLGAWLTASTTPLSLTSAISRAVAPLGSLGLPVADLVLVTGLGLRLLPDLLEAAGRVRLAQQARGVVSGRRWRERWRSIEATGLALFAFAFRRADELALALEVRGYRPGQSWPRSQRSMVGPVDVLALLIGFLAAAGLVWLGRR